MKIEIEIPDKNISEILESLPEASNGSVLTCHGWDYNKNEFDFTDDITGKEYTLTLPLAIEGLQKMFSDIFSGKLNRSDIPIPFESELGNWDAGAIDILVQYSLLGKLIYG